MISYWKTQWFRVLIAFACLVMCCVYAFSPSPDTTTIEGLDKVITNLANAGLYFLGFSIWMIMSFIYYLQDRIELLEAKAEKYEALADKVAALQELIETERKYSDKLKEKPTTPAVQQKED